jgi:Arc/MetJ-type ribon-helix-helix transcriptional regulator
MKILQVELSDKAAAELDALIETGWFTDETEIIRLALKDFVHRHKFALLEQFQREDIDWALRHKSLGEQ